MTDQDTRGEVTGVTSEDAILPEDPQPATGMTFLEFLIILARRKRLVALVTAIATLAGVVTSLLLPVRYTATTQLLTPQQTESAAMMMSQLANTAAGSMAALTAGGLGLRNPNEIYIGMLNSRPIADAIIRDYNLVEVYHAKDMTAARKELAANTKIAAQKSSFISISVTDKDKMRAAGIANAYTAQLRNLTQSIEATEALQRQIFYEGQLKSAKETLVAAEISFQHVEQTKGVLQPQDQARVMIESLAALRAQAAAKSVELQALRSYSTDRNPEVQLTENELATLQAEAARMGQKQHTAGFSDLSLGDVPGAGIDYLSAEHELVYRQTLFDLLIKQYDAAKLDESKEATVIQVVEPAIPPDRKASPHRTLIVLLFMLFGLLAACSYVYTYDFIQKNPALAQSITEFRSALVGKWS